MAVRFGEGTAAFVFPLRRWRNSVESANITCPHAVTRDLTPWEIDVLDTSTMRSEAEKTSTNSAIEVCLELEFEYFNELKQKVFYTRPRANRSSRAQGVQPQEFRSCSYNVAYGILKSIFSEKNPHLLHALLKLPVHTTFSNGDQIAQLFKFRGQQYVSATTVEKIFGHLRKYYCQRGLTATQSNALYEYLRMKPVQQNIDLTNKSNSPPAFRGSKIGRAALRKAYPFAGRHPGTPGAKQEKSAQAVTPQAQPSGSFGMLDII